MQHRISVRRSLAAGYCYAGFFLSIFLPPAICAGAQSIIPTRVDIGNFGQVNADYFRGSQPGAAAFEELKQLGIRTVIDLQEDANQWESECVRSNGMRYFNIPLSSRRPATEQQTEHFLMLVNDPQNMPVYVHCAGGRHRTGEMTAIYRLVHDGWTADQAYREMKQYGYYSVWGHGSLKQYVYQYYSKLSAAGNKAKAVTLSLVVNK
jgi:protein tyrosine/serine phosphatase